MTPCAPHTGPPRTPRERTPCLLGVRAHPALSPRILLSSAGDGWNPGVKSSKQHGRHYIYTSIEINTYCSYEIGKIFFNKIYFT